MSSSTLHAVIPAAELENHAIPHLVLNPHSHALSDGLLATTAHVRQSSVSTHRLHASPSEAEREERDRERVDKTQEHERDRPKDGITISAPIPSSSASPSPASSDVSAIVVDAAAPTVLSPVPQSPLPPLSTSFGPLDDAPHTPQPSTPVSARTSFLPPPPAIRAASAHTSYADAYTTSPDNGLHHSGEKRVAAASTSSSRPPSRQMSTSDAALTLRSLPAPPSSSSSSISISPERPGPSERLIKVTTEALSLRKQSLRHPAPSSAASTSQASLDVSDLHTLRALITFQNKEIASYKNQILTLTSENTRLAAELRAYPHSAAEVARLLSSLRGEVKGLEGRVSVLMGEKKVWSVQMKNFHAEMSHMEKEWIKDRARLEEQLARAEERNERMLVEWEEREDKMSQLTRERRREQDDLDRARAEAREAERRWTELQEEHDRLLRAWREERVSQTEAEGRMKGAMYVRLFRLMQEVSEKERASEQWDREMGRREQVQRGVEELERRYLALIDGVRERDAAIERLTRDNERLASVLLEESAKGLAWFQHAAATTQPGPASATSSATPISPPSSLRSPRAGPPPPPPAPATAYHTPNVVGRGRSGSANPGLAPLPFPSLLEGHEHEPARAASAVVLPTTVHPFSTTSAAAAAVASSSARRPSLSSSASVPSLSIPDSSCAPVVPASLKADGEEEQKQRPSTLPVPTSSSSARGTGLSSPTSFLSGLQSTVSSLTPSRAKAAAFDFFSFPRAARHTAEGKEADGEDAE